MEQLTKCNVFGVIIVSEAILFAIASGDSLRAIDIGLPILRGSTTHSNVSLLLFVPSICDMNE
jgi:hypothetical protein